MGDEIDAQQGQTSGVISSQNVKDQEKPEIPEEIPVISSPPPSSSKDDKSKEKKTKEKKTKEKKPKDKKDITTDDKVIVKPSARFDIPEPAKDKKNKKKDKNKDKKNDKDDDLSENFITTEQGKLEIESTVLLVSTQSDVRMQPSKKSDLEIKGKSSTGGLTAKSKKSKKSVKSFSQVTQHQDDEESYSTGSTQSEEEKLTVKQVRSKRKKVGKGKVVKVMGDVEDTGAESVEIEEDVVKKGKKGKKDKKGKKEKKEEVKEEEEEDVMAQILKLKAELAAPTESITATEGSKKSGKKEKKKGGGKKKKEKKMTEKMAEQLRLEAEQEAARQAELEKIRLAEEKVAAIENERKEQIESQVREDQLSKSMRSAKQAQEFYKESTRAELEEEEWKLYLECRKLPNPYFCNQMNTYLHVWNEEIENTDVTQASLRTKDTLKLIDDLEELIATSPEAIENSEKWKNWIWIRQLFRDYQQQSLDIASYLLLRNVIKNLVRIDIPSANYDFKDEFVKLCLWLRVQLPIPLPNPRRPPKPRIDVTFQNLDYLQIILPITIDLEKLALRAMYLKYDHLSDTCSFYYIPPVPPHYNLDLRKSCKKEWRTKLKYKYDHREKKPVPVFDTEDESAAAFVPEPEDFASDEDIPFVPYKKLEPTASEYTIALEENDYFNAQTNFKIEVPEFVINLRKFIILGGVFYINLIHQPPQPQDYVLLDLNITRLFIPKQLELADFNVSYVPPVPSDPDVRKSPEEIEEEMKKSEEALDSMININLTWPQHVMFLELPFICAWDEKEKFWTNRNVHDLKPNEEKGTLSFKTQTFGIFGLATLRYANLPYQAWEIKPEENGSVNISLTAAILIFEFNVQDGKICLTWVQNSPNNALKPYLGQYMTLYNLKKIFKQTGIDIFPEHDAFCYVEGSCEKHWPMEKNLYCNMAALSGCFNFAWSRWNLSLGRRTVVFLLREFTLDKSKLKNYSTLLVTPLKATIISCTEVSQEFSDEPAEAIKYCADLLNLMKAISGIAIRKKVEEFSKLNYYTISEFLIATRVLSFS